jgi:hypothetical protein
MNWSQMRREIIGPWLYDMSSAMVRKVGTQSLADLLEQAEVEGEQIAVDAVQQLRLIVVGEHHPVKAEQRARKPEEAFERDPDNGLAARLAGGPGAHGIDGRAVIGIERGQHAQVVVHIGDGAFDVVLHGFDGGCRGGKPELLIGIEAKVFGDFENAGEVGGESLGVPAIDGQVPPHGPLPAGQAVDGLKIHEGAKTFDVIHGFCVRFSCDHGTRDA